MNYKVIDENGNIINVIVWDGMTPLNIPNRLEKVEEVQEIESNKEQETSNTKAS